MTRQEKPDWKELELELGVIIKLLGRIAFNEQDVKRIVTFKKGNKAKDYIRGYNECDGKKSLQELAKIIGVSPSTLSPILKSWEEEGIVYRTLDGKYKRVFKKLR